MPILLIFRTFILVGDIMKEPKLLLEKKKVFVNFEDIENDKKKAKARIDIAARLILLRNNIRGKDAESDKRIVNSILKELKDYTGGLISDEIETLNLLSTKYNATEKVGQKLYNYKSEHREELKVYECPTIGASKLKPPVIRILTKFTQLLDSSFDKKSTKIIFRDIKIRFDLLHRNYDSKQLRRKITEYTMWSRDQFEKNPILINQDNQLVDGYLRLMAMKRLMKNSEDFNVYANQIQTKDDDHLKQLMYHFNNEHGQPISTDKKKEYAQELKEKHDLPNEEIAKRFGVSRQAIDKWTKGIRQSKTKIERKQILDLYAEGNCQAAIIKKNHT